MLPAGPGRMTPVRVEDTTLGLKLTGRGSASAGGIREGVAGSMQSIGGGWFGPRVPRESTAHGEQRPLAKGYFYRRISNSVKLAKVVPIIAELVTATGRGQ